MDVSPAYRRGTTPRDVALVETATRQHGVVSRRQLLAMGFDGSAIDRRITAGRLQPIHAGVYAVGHRRLLRYARYMAGVLACGDRSALSHRSAAALWGLRQAPSGPVEVTTTTGAGRRRPGIEVRATRSLPAAEVSTCEGVPCTTVARTLVDLAAVVPPGHLQRALEQAYFLQLFDRAALDAVLERSRGRHGIGKLRRLLADLTDEPLLVRSKLERRFLRLVRGAALPAPLVNGYVADLQVDFHWPEARLMVETDGRAAHDHTLAFERDRRRDLALTLDGWHVVRVTWRQVVNEPGAVAAMLRARLRARPASQRRPRGRAAATRRRTRPPR
jgi:predicted transcriptional regulator of viral defense system